jgi:tetratricopeptide (TPR) repeat protein
MRNQFFLCIGVFCALAVFGTTGAARADETPTVGGQPAFATSTDVKLSTIRSLIEARDYESAERMAVEVTVEAPDVVDGWMMLGYTRTLNGRFAESNQAYEKALDSGADRKEVYTLKAYNCRRLGDVEATRTCFQEILEVDANNIDILMQYGTYENSVENPDAAVEVFEQALELSPGNLEAILQLAKAEEKRGNPPRVKYWIEQGLTYHPEDPKLLSRIALVYLNEQNYSLSIHYLNKLLEVDPENAKAYRNLGIAHYQQGNKREAAESFEQVRVLGGKMNGLYGPLADCYRSINQRSKSLDVVREGLAAGEQEAWLYSVWGKLLEDAKEYDLAIAKFNKAVAMRDEPWSGYARKQIARQAQLIKREKMIAAQGGME